MKDHEHIWKCISLVCLYIYMYVCIICMYIKCIYIYIYVPHVFADATETRMDYNWPTCVLNYCFTCLNEEMLRLVVTSYFNNSLLKLGFMGHFTSKNGGPEWSSFCKYNPWRCTYHYQPTISAENGWWFHGITHKQWTCWTTHCHYPSKTGLLLDGDDE